MACSILSISCYWKVLGIPLTLGTLCCLLFMLSDVRFSFPHIAFPLCFRHLRSRNSFCQPESFPSILSDCLRDFGLPLVVIDVDLLKCLSVGSDCSSSINGRKRLFHFGAFSDEWATVAKFNTVSDGVGSQTFVQTNNWNFTVVVSLIQDRGTYWFIGAYQTLDAFAILKWKLKSILVSSSVSVRVPADLGYAVWQLERGRFLECNRSMAARFRRDYPQFYSKKPLILDSAVSDLAHFRDVLHRLRLSPILFGGTLLGWYRECGIIPYTSDLDLVSFASEFSQQLVEALKADQRLRLHWILGKPDDSLEISVFAGGIKMDLFFLYEEVESNWVGGMIVYKRKKLRWQYPKMAGICSCDLKGQLFFVPCNTEQFLSADYGVNWSQPFHDSKFVWYKSHRNIQEAGLWSAAQWPSVYRTHF